MKFQTSKSTVREVTVPLDLLWRIIKTSTMDLF